MHRFYWPPEVPPPSADGTIITGELASHLAAVRLEAGEVVECFNERGYRCACRIGRDARRFTLTPDPSTELPAPPVPRKKLTVWIPAIEPARFDWAAEKLTELGVERIGVFRADRTNAHPRSAERIRRVMIRAVEQSGRMTIPVWLEAKTLDDILDMHPIILEIPGRENSVPLSGLILDPELSLVVGPEGGWSPGELERFHRTDCRFAHLVPSTLRAETAAVSAAAIVLS